MPSYAQNVKEELARKFEDDKNCMRAELAAIFKISGNATEGRIEFSSVNAAVVRRVINLVKKIYPDVRKEIAAVRTKRLRNTMRYFVRIFLNGEAADFFESINSRKIPRRHEVRVAYMRGAFLANGTIVRPEKYYCLEISSGYESAANIVKKIFKQLELKAGFRVRREDFVVYLREADSILDFLWMLGANEAIERFEAARNLKEVRANINRITNCEMAGLNKAIDAAQRQIADIRLLRENDVEVDEALEQVMELRLQNPESTMGELAKKFFMTSKGLGYRFKLIHELAEKIRNAEFFNPNSPQGQLADIQLIIDSAVDVKEIIQQTMEMRLQNPDSTVSELAKKFFITREGLNYRFKQIHALAEKIRQQANLDKMLDEAKIQLADIQILLDNKVEVSEIIQQTMKMRLENPDCTVDELSQKFSVARAWLNYRFELIHKLATKFQRK